MKFFLSHKWVVAIVIVCLGVSSFFVISSQIKPSENYVVVEQRSLRQEVNVTGRVEPTNSVDLAFERSGRVVGVYSDIGDLVTRGRRLASLESAELQAQLLQTQAAVKSQEAKLLELQKGVRPEEIQVQQTKVDNAQLATANAQDALVNAMQDAYTKSDDAIRNKVDQFFSLPRGNNPQINFPVNSAQLEIELESSRVVLESTLIAWQMSVAEGMFSDSLVSTTDQNLKAVKLFLDNASLAVNALTPTSGLSQTTIDAWKSAVSTARSNVNTSITSFITAQETFSNAKVALVLAKNELSLKEAGATSEQLLAQEAQLEEAISRVKSVEAQIAQASLFSPINGVVTRRDIQVGEIASVGKPVISIISNGSYEIKANLPEADIAKIHLSSQARVTLDAYGDDQIFEAEVVEIEPSERIIDGVSTYRVTLFFLTDDERIRSGMTADIDIVTGERTDVLALPFRNIRTEDGERVVYVLDENGDTERRVVKTGLRGVDGFVEITSGVSLGERIATDE